VLDTIQRAAETGTQILHATHVADDLVPAVTHVLKLDAGRIVDRAGLPLGNKEARLFPSSKMEVRRDFLTPKPPMAEECDTLRDSKEERNQQEFLIRIKDTDVYVGGRKILHDLDWTIRPGENWAVLGKNGSGKTTLLKLLIGEINPRLGGSIHRFGDDNPRTIWEIRCRISHVSADLQAIHMDGQTGLQTVLSGFFGSIGLHDTPTQRQVETAKDWMAFFGLDSLASRDIRTLSYGQFRMLLIARALVTDPDILLLDEPTAGLDTFAIQSTLSLIENLTLHGTYIVYVTHRPELMLRCITHVAVMHTGRLTFQGSRRQFDSLHG